VITSLTWTPDSGKPETLITDIPEGLLAQMRDLIGTPEWAGSEAVMRINTKVGDQPWTKRLYRLARITALEPEDPS
jgi:hypothetical protein